MQAFFAVVGDSDPSARMFDGLAEATAASNPGSELQLHDGPHIRIGTTSRSFHTLLIEPRGLGLYLDGEVRSIAGVQVAADQSTQVTLREIANRFEREGDGVWRLLDGSFRLLIMDGATAHLGTDVAGARALYWWAEDGLLACHSHLMDLAPSYPRELADDLGAIAHYCETGRYPPALTAFEGISYLGAGHSLAAASDGVHQREHYTRAPEPPERERPFDSLVDDMVELSSDAVSACFANADRPVFPLSGGMDSRMIAVLAVRQFGADSVRTITWGEDPDRPSSDAVVARQVAEKLGVENVWHEKGQVHTSETFARAVYLSSGEGDCAIHYPEDHVLHEELAQMHGFRSLFRGDELVGGTHPLRILTQRGAIGGAGVFRISMDDQYPQLLGDVLFESMADEQAQIVAELTGNLRACTNFGKRLELIYAIEYRRELAPHNVLKNGDLEVFNPLLDRHLNEWIRLVPDDAVAGKRVLLEALKRVDPELSTIPFAERSNLPAWGRRWATDPSISEFFRDWCSQPGWLDEVGAKDSVLAAIDVMAQSAKASSGSEDLGTSAPQPSRLNSALRGTLAARLVSEATIEYRGARRNLPMYLRISRLAVLHWMIGEVRRRKASRQGQA